MHASRRGTPDFLLLFMAFALTAFGLLMVFSASSATASYYNDNPFHFVIRQVIGIVLGLIGMIFTMNVHYSNLKKLTIPFMFIVLSLLLLVPIIGVERNGARSWFALGPLNLQPAEFAKIGIILYLASLISNKEERFADFKKGWRPGFVVLAVVAGLIMLQPDFGSCLILVLGAMLVIVVGGANLKQISLLVLIVLCLGFLGSGLYLLSHPNSYQLERFVIFHNPWEHRLGPGFQIIQSLYAFGHGGLFGAGFGQSIQKMHYLTQAHNDFIFAIIGEEFGFIGTALFLLFYIAFIWRGFLISMRCNHLFGMLAGVGIMGMLAIQALINLAGVSHTIPLTGVTLPLISYGGSSMIATLPAIGIVLGMSREFNREPAPQDRSRAKRSAVRGI